MVATDHITSEPESQSFYNDAYDGEKIVLEDATFGDAQMLGDANANEAGSITDIRIINKGSGYTQLPLISSISTTSGSGAKLKGIYYILVVLTQFKLLILDLIILLHQL